MLQWGLAIFVALTVNMALFLAMQQLLAKTEKPPVLEKKTMHIVAVTPPLLSPQPKVIPNVDMTRPLPIIPNPIISPPPILTEPPPLPVDIPTLTPSVDIPLAIVGSAYLGQVSHPAKKQKKRVKKRQKTPPKKMSPTIKKPAITPSKKKIDLSVHSLNKALAVAEKQQQHKPVSKIHDAKQFQSRVNVTPTYPRRAQKRGITGHINVEFTILPSGKITNIAIISGENVRYFEKVVLTALKKSHYRPLKSAVRARRTYHFRLEH